MVPRRQSMADRRDRIARAITAAKLARADWPIYLDGDDDLENAIAYLERVWRLLIDDMRGDIAPDPGP